MKNKKIFEKAQKLMNQIAEIRVKLKEIEYNRSQKILSDFTEAYARDRFGLELKKSRNNPGYDATDKNGKKYQIKYTILEKSGEKEKFTSYINNLEIDAFDYLIVVVLNESYNIIEVYKISSSDLLKEKDFLSKDKKTFKIGQVIEKLRDSKYRVKIK